MKTGSATKRSETAALMLLKRPKLSILWRQVSSLKNESNGSRCCWNKAKSLSHISTPKESMPPLEDDDKEVCLPAAKANLLARFFALHSTDKDPHNTLCGVPYPLQQESPSFDFRSVKEESVLR